jgi:hypothetical protein
MALAIPMKLGDDGDGLILINPLTDEADGPAYRARYKNSATLLVMT